MVEILVNSTAPYKKTLKGKFTLVVGQENVSYEIEDAAQNPYMELNITNTLSYYIVDEAFDQYSKNDRINIDDYLELSEDKKAKCHSAIVKIDFDPREVLLDITSAEYSTAVERKTTTINGYTYVNSITIEIDASSSADLRFYKVDVSKDYTYPNGNSSSILQITSW